MDINKYKYAYIIILFGFLMITLVTALYLPTPRTSEAEDDAVVAMDFQGNSSVSSFLDNIIGESNEPKAKPDAIVTDLRETMTDESDLPVENIWYAGTWDPAFYPDARHPKTVAIKMQLLDKASKRPIKDVGVSVRGEYEHQWTRSDVQGQVDLSIFHDLRKMKPQELPPQKRTFKLDAISDSNGIVVFALNWQKEYAWPTAEGAASMRPGDIECVATLHVNHPDCKNADIPVGFKRMTVPKPVVLDLGGGFSDFRNKRSRRIEFFEKIRAEDYSDLRNVADSEKKTKSGPYFVYDLGEVLLECTLPPQRKASRPESPPVREPVVTRRPEPSQETKPPEKKVEPKVHITQVSRPEPERTEPPKPVARTPEPVVKAPEVSQVELDERIIDFGDGVTMRFKLIPAGEFQMGSPPSERGRDSDEGPVHTVRIDKPFFMGVHEVTQEQYQKVMGTNPSRYTGAKYPVHMVSWYEAKEFCEKLSSVTNERFRLPTEVEWEYACRAGSSTAYYWGNSFDDRYAWTLRNSRGAIQEVGTRLPNAWGLYDMSGNLWEWCEDAYNRNYPGSEEATTRRMRFKNNDRILRGGSWNVNPEFSRSANRSRNVPETQMDYDGFRVVMEAK